MFRLGILVMIDTDNFDALCNCNILKDFDVDDESLKKVMKNIAGVDLGKYEEIHIPKIGRLRMWCDAKTFMDEIYSLHDVGYLSDRKLCRALNRELVILSDEDVARIFNRNIKKINPFFLPIFFSHSSIVGASLHTQGITNKFSEDQEKLLSLLDVCFTKINLPKNVTMIAPTSYVHEIVHTQIISNKGAVEDFYNNEALSIYVELLHAYKRGNYLFVFDLANRLTNAIANYYSLYIYEHGDRNKLDDGYDKSRFHSDACYLQSTLIAFNLFIKTIYGTGFTRNTISGQIQKVFDGKITVEQFLKSVGATYDDSKDEKYVKKLLKHLS